MTRVELPFVNAQKSRGGRLRYWYFRRAGRRWRLPGAPFEPAFMVEYQRLLAATEPKPVSSTPALLPGSFGALVTDYLASPEFRGTKPSTQKIYRLVLEPLAEFNGRKPVALLERRHLVADSHPGQLVNKVPGIRWLFHSSFSFPCKTGAKAPILH